MHKGQIISSPLSPMKYLKPLSLCSDFSDNTIYKHIFYMILFG